MYININCMLEYNKILRRVMIMIKFYKTTSKSNYLMLLAFLIFISRYLSSCSNKTGTSDFPDCFVGTYISVLILMKKEAVQKEYGTSQMTGRLQGRVQQNKNSISQGS